MRTTVDSSAAQPTPMENGAVVSTCACCFQKMDMKSRSVDRAMQSAAIAAKLDISGRCAGNVRNHWSSQVPRAAVARAAVKAAQAAATPSSATVVDRSAIEDLIVLVEMRIAVAVVNEDI